MVSFNLLDRNLSFYAVPAAWALAIVPHAVAISLYKANASEKFNMSSPRGFTQKLESDKSVDQATKDKIIRTEHASQNGFENVGLFAAAVVAANVARLDVKYLNGLSIGYVLSRALYNFIYISNTTDAVALLRTTTFFGGIGCIWTMFILAGRKLF